MGGPPNPMIPRGLPMGYVPPNMMYGMYPPLMYPQQHMYAAPPKDLGNRSVDWSEYKTPEGKKYWANNITKETTWDEPAPVKAERERKEAENDLPDEAGWVQLRDPNNKPYYKNKTSGVTQTSMPKEVREYRKKQEAEKIAAAIKPRTTTQQDSSPARTPSVAAKTLTTTTVLPETTKKPPAAVDHSKPERIYESRSERKDVFKQMLKDLNISTSARYEEIVRQILTDDRYEALKSKNDRAAAFEEYCQATLKQKKGQEAEELKTKVEAFTKMLSEGKAADKFKEPISFETVRKLFDKDPRFVAIDQESLRKKVTQEYMSDLSKEQMAIQRERRHQKVLAFGELLKKENTQSSDKWSRISGLLNNRDPRYSDLSEKDRKFAFAEYVSHLRNNEELEATQNHFQSQARIRHLRKDLCDRMKTDILRGKLHHFVTFDKYLSTLDKGLYRGLLPELVEDMFLMMTTELISEYPKHKKVLKKMVVEGKFDPLNTESEGEGVGPPGTPAWAVAAFVWVCRERIKERRSIIKSITNRLVDGLYATVGSNVSWPEEARSYFNTNPFWFDLLEFDNNSDTWIESAHNNYNKLLQNKKQKDKRSDRERSRGRKRRKD
eukprot:TRINITY_DN23141_c0_g1_i1.p1 TRINITY_DN23141_c0_g1~~TRINITY_DN23141_c0_g1_i1.p1  ORF type:complete len:608 (+),score=140.41 TRINITY_DN23141_c0_g1_i1:34-1857(+)